jgi:glutaconate CoA-transferase subunit B
VDVDQVRASTGWDLAVTDHHGTTDPPTVEELEVLRALKARTKAAHAK